MDIRRIQNRIKAWHDKLPLHWVLAVLVAINGLALLRPGLDAIYVQHPTSWTGWLDAANVQAFMGSLGLPMLLRIVLGGVLAVMALGLILRARIAWAAALLLLIGSVIYYLLRTHTYAGLVGYTVILVVILLLYWRRFDRSSVAAGSLFATLGITSLLIYAVLGSLYLGSEFKPPIEDAATAFYFSIVSMSTVGYGDITPHTAAARLFTASVIILGITVFATSISAIAGPVIGGRIQHLVHGKLHKPMRKNHIIIAGVTPLAQNAYRALTSRGHEATVIVPNGASHDYPDTTDILVGDATDAEALKEAGAEHARYIMALHSDDSENAFIVLAAKEAGGPGTRSVALANTLTHVKKIQRVNPDIVFSLQSLGAEILTRMVTGESIDDALLANMLFSPPKGEKPTT
ncbi:voltage-gated potassium channel protein [Pusillimonas sp. TS35]|nr:voltage-gated potassium channel protein [Paracandidimonas lactea]MYN13957.1 voltage-gated potassium channel protein [Pusillimonas sp. TS35]